MKARHRLFLRRKSVYYAFDNLTRKFQSLDTRERDEAVRLVHSLNEAARQPTMNLRLARVYLQHSDPAFSSRTWQHVMDESAKTKKPLTAHRWRNAMQQPVFDRIRRLVIIEIRAEHFLATMESGTVSTNASLRQVHNFALDMNWLLVPVVPRKLWPKVRYQDKRGVKRNVTVLGRRKRFPCSNQGRDRGPKLLGIKGRFPARVRPRRHAAVPPTHPSS